MANGFF